MYRITNATVLDIPTQGNSMNAFFRTTKHMWTVRANFHEHSRVRAGKMNHYNIHQLPRNMWMTPELYWILSFIPFGIKCWNTYFHTECLLFYLLFSLLSRKVFTGLVPTSLFNQSAHAQYQAITLCYFKYSLNFSFTDKVRKNKA